MITVQQGWSHSSKLQREISLNTEIIMWGKKTNMDTRTNRMTY